MRRRTSRAPGPSARPSGRCRGAFLHVAALVVVVGGVFYLLFVWWPTYLTHIVTPHVPHALLANTLCMVALFILVPVGGWLSDLIGRRTVLVVAAMGAMVLVAHPLLRLDRPGDLRLRAGGTADPHHPHGRGGRPDTDYLIAMTLVSLAAALAWAPARTAG